MTATTIVLVHGAWGGSWAWKPVARELRQRGFEVYAPNLSGVGARHHIPPEIVDLDIHIEDVAALLRFEELDNVLLVGHSYGGMVITGAADREIDRIKGMIYLDAFLPESGQSLWDVMGAEGAEKQRLAAQNYDGGRSLPPNFLYRERDRGAQSEPVYTAHPIKTVSQPWISVRTIETWPARHYIACTQTPMPFFRMAAERVRTLPGWSEEEVDAAHDVLLTHVHLITEKITEFAARIANGA
jgi:pimeloyl-ACP methyl ester carboxylesterase